MVHLFCSLASEPCDVDLDSKFPQQGKNGGPLLSSLDRGTFDVLLVFSLRFSHILSCFLNVYRVPGPIFVSGCPSLQEVLHT